MVLAECNASDAKYFYLTNDKKIPAFTTLTVHVQVPKPKALQNVTVVAPEKKARGRPPTRSQPLSKKRKPSE